MSVEYFSCVLVNVAGLETLRLVRHRQDSSVDPLDHGRLEVRGVVVGWDCAALLGYCLDPGFALLGFERRSVFIVGLIAHAFENGFDKRKRVERCVFASSSNQRLVGVLLVAPH